MADCLDGATQLSKKVANRIARIRYQERKKIRRTISRALAEGDEENEERYVNINSALNGLYCPDTGADVDIIPKSILDDLLVKCPDLEVVQLGEPLKGLGCNDQGFESKAYVELDLTMQTSAGAVRVPGRRKCYVVEEGDELLVSDQTLRLVGINIDRLLTAQRMANEDDDLEEIDLEPPRLRRRYVVYMRTARLGLPKPKTELETALAAMVQEACDEGFPGDLVGRLWSALTKHDIWRLKFNGSDPPAKVEPLRVTPKEACEPYRCKGRLHNPLETRFLTLFGKELLDAGVIRHNQQSQWCSPVNPVIKPEGRRMLKAADKWTDDEVLKYYRLTNDYRVNSKTIPKAGTMPFQSTITQHLRGKKALGTFDMPKCFWQFPLDPASQDMLSFMLNGWVMTPNRVMQGHVDSALYVQSTCEDCYAPLLNKHLLVWIDDILVYADDPVEYVKVLVRFFDLVNEHGFKLSPTKTKLYTKEVKWCGRYLSDTGVKQDPDRIEALCAIPEPTNAGDLQHFICATKWLRESITEHAQTVEPLQRCLTRALEGKSKKKRIASGIQIQLTDAEKQAFAAVKKLASSRG
ncbi:hypothetical protein Ae201684P_022451 [Aphanomyces euteiches]|uniref:Reverse transcriptase domain-containing protein n=1 Tax=Aphanomyces euteiches TaxID=100861 RepID=A0A6G0X6B1_9STRA|nr:hypothetical protein Ae201684_008018 [Aphanomyces euteiches]KAH9074649.1 hypothetical protein Ae201684P_022451 [Aphanomyces euteiches]